MSHSIPALFKTSLIAAAVVSLSACSTAPRTEEGYGLSRVGEGILTAGRATADVSERVWSKTTYLLGFSGDDAEQQSDDVLLMDAEDMARLEDGNIVAPDTTIRPIVIRSAVPMQPQQVEPPTNTELADNDETSGFETPINRKSEALTQTATIITSSATDTQVESAIVAKDRVHKVTSSETLWDIAKMTTGDATNWHVLADVNNLGPNASVYPGDLLIIPADMIEPLSSDSVASEATAQQAPEQIFVDTQNLTGTLKSQASAVAAQPQLEASTTVQAALSDTAEPQQLNGTAFTLKPGETLWDFAKRTTGDATNWKAIAGQNNFSAKQASLVRSGQTIYVPEDLIKQDLESAIDTAAPDLNATANNQSSDVDTTLETIKTAADTSRTAVEPAPAQTEALRTLTISSASTLTDVANDTDLLNVGTDRLPVPLTGIDAKQPIKIVEATFKSDEIAAPLSQAAEAIKKVDPNTHSPEQIMVSGTYYPKAIYNNADFSSSLLMRVSPGTTLQVSKAMGNWYQVKTSKGLGYVHQRDIK